MQCHVWRSSKMSLISNTKPSRWKVGSCSFTSVCGRCFPKMTNEMTCWLFCTLSHTETVIPPWKLLQSWWMRRWRRSRTSFFRFSSTEWTNAERYGSSVNKTLLARLHLQVCVCLLRASWQIYRSTWTRPKRWSTCWWGRSWWSGRGGSRKPASAHQSAFVWIRWRNGTCTRVLPLSYSSSGFLLYEFPSVTLNNTAKLGKRVVLMLLMLEF